MDSEQMIRRICDLDIILANIQDRLDKIDASYEDLREKSVQKQDFERNNVNLLSLMPHNNANLNKNLQEIDHNIDLLKNNSLTYKQQIDALFERNFKHNARLDKIDASLVFSLDKHTQNDQKLNKVDLSLAELRKLTQNLNECQDVISNQVNGLQEIVEFHKSRLKISTENLGGLKLSHQLQNLETKEVLENVKSDISQMKDNLNSFNDALSAYNQSNLKMMDDKIASIPKVEIPPQVDIKSAVSQEFNSLCEKLDSIKLDLENSSLRYNNNEIQTRVFEKKLENLTLQLKKIEITQSS